MPINKAISVEAGNKRLCMVRSEEGFFAMDENCPHQGLPMSRGGICEGGKIICPFHRYAWDLKTGRETRGQEPNINLYPVEARKDGLFVGIGMKKRWLF